jgi:hypothetical protein
LGLKEAPSYFQRELSMTVLKGLLGYGVELYLDDVIVYGSTEEEFLDNLKRVFQRFHEFNITLNPKKCRFGVRSIEYVGHIIDEHGIRFSKEQTDKVLNFKEPIMVKDLMSFMGLVNYFGDHIPHLAEKLKPLRDMEKESRKSKKLHWTPERRQYFLEVKAALVDLPKLFFINDSDEIRVYADASDYAIGGYVCQVVNGVERPIGFMSRTLVNAERRWTAIEKECYALHMTLKKFEYLLRDVPFTLYTDHANLVYLNVPPSNKVLRWKMAMQEYNFRLFHIPGEKNVVADGFSRLTEETPSESSILLNVIEEPNYSVDSELIRASEESHALDVRASPLADIASRGILRSSEHQNNVLVMKATGYSEPTPHSNMASAVLTAYHPSSDHEEINTELISLSRPIIPPDAEVLDKTVSPLTAPNSVPPQTLRPVFPGPTTQSVKPQLDTVLYTPNLGGYLAPLDVTEPTATRRSSRILNKQSASQELPSPSLENPTTTQLSIENEQISNAPPSQTVGQSPSLAPDVYNWCSSVHNSWMGHRGVRQTLEMLHQRGHIWPTMKSDVSNFISM